MCGINGLIGFPDPKRLIQAMNESIKHRGPDAEGQWSDNHITLGHRRLSIIDLSSLANQPLIKDNLIIVYNGEVYNFLELKEDLLKKGVTFRTKSDTEVVLELFRIYRQESFSKLIGMFSFCIYDARRKELFLVRDYFGIKPLYYTIAGSKFAFSSELKALTNLPGIEKDINPKVLVSCINYIWNYTNESIFKQIKKIPPAHYLHLIINDNNLEISIRKFWNIEANIWHSSEKKIKEKLISLLEKSVKKHLIADVPVGSFLSGGLDSSLVTAIARKFNANLSTYTISITPKDKRIEKMPDDNKYAKKVARILNIRHADIKVNPELLDNLKDMVYALDEPLGDPAAINTYLICKAARENGTKVLLSGMGADEIFGGYRRHYATLIANRLSKNPLFFKKIFKNTLTYLPVRIGQYGIRQTRWLKRLFSFIDMPIDLAYMRSYSYYSKESLGRLFNYNFNDTIEQIYKEHSEVFYQIKEFDDLNKMCYTDINMFMPGLNLAYTDRASMAASVEVRVPFIDREVIEFAMSVESNYKIHRGVSKYILKKVAMDYLPRDIVYRPKASFTMPIRSWIADDLRSMVDDVLSISVIKRRGILNYEYIREIIEKDRQGLEDNAYRIYQLLTLELWFRRFIDG
jgi:asparagine synthase (glutamine-hydrolysing)